MSATGTRINVTAFDAESQDFLGTFKNWSTKFENEIVEAAQGAEMTAKQCIVKLSSDFDAEFETDNASCRDTSLNVSGLTILGADINEKFDSFDIEATIGMSNTDGGATLHRFNQAHKRSYSGNIKVFDRFADDPAELLNVFPAGVIADFNTTLVVDTGVYAYNIPVVIKGGSLDVDDLITNGLSWVARGAPTAPTDADTSVWGVIFAGTGLIDVQTEITYDTRVLTMSATGLAKSLRHSVSNGQISSLAMSLAMQELWTFDRGE